MKNTFNRTMNDLNSRVSFALNILFFVALVFNKTTLGYSVLIAYFAWLALLIYRIQRDIRSKAFGIWTILYILLAIFATASIVFWLLS